jgi:hypothetical protein
LHPTAPAPTPPTTTPAAATIAPTTTDFASSGAVDGEAARASAGAGAGAGAVPPTEEELERQHREAYGCARLEDAHTQLMAAAAALDAIIMSEQADRGVRIELVVFPPPPPGIGCDPPPPLC